MPDASILAVAKTLPNTRRALADLREFTGRASRSELDRWWTAVETGLATSQLPAVRVPSDSPPPPRAWAMRNPEADARLRVAKAGVAEVAERLEMPVENLLTPDHLRRVAWQPPAEPTTAAVLGLLLATMPGIAGRTAPGDAPAALADFFRPGVVFQDRNGDGVVDFVDARLAGIAGDDNLSRYIL